jgi:asparagine synthase (glutamine-hydrolysing)
MCGICGELRLDGGVPELSAIRGMMEVLSRRGPDRGGSYSDGPLAFGHRRLAIIDLSPHASQPMVDMELGLAIVFNGTIYNYPELRAELAARGHHFFSHGDTEVILKAYAEWGERCPVQLHGMFAFAIWNMRDQSLFMARDRFGIKPFYYACGRDRFRFASTTQALLAAGEVDISLDPVALHHHLTLHAVVPAPRTVLRGIRKLPPGHSLTIDAKGDKHFLRYWRPRPGSAAGTLSEWEWIEAIRESLERAVERRQVIADVPVGVLLSGGLDSSLLVALLALRGGTELHTFSVGFEDVADERGSEFEYSDAVARRYGTRHHRFSIANEELLRRLPEAIDNMAEPMVGQDAVAFYLLGERVSREVKVVQSGQGADEVFGGYFWYPLMDEATGTDIERFRLHYFDRDHDEWLRTVTAPFHGPDYTSAKVAWGLAQSADEHFLNRVLGYDVTTLIVDDPVKRVDNMTMAWGLEARVPFLDHELVELVLQMPPAYKIKSGGKHPLKMIARDLLPDEVINRPTGYFPVPALKYVRGRMLEFMREVLGSRSCRERDLYQRDYVDRLLADPERHLTPIRGSKLWHLALLEFWLQRNVDQVTARPNAEPQG